MKMKKGIIFAIALLVSASAYATALSAARDTVERSGEVVSLTVKSNQTIYAGSGVSVDSSGYAVSASDATGDKFVGRAEVTKKNTGDDYSATMAINVKRGTFAWANGAGYTDANIGDYTYVFDDATVNSAASNTYDIIAGVIVDVDSANGVWVDCLASGGQGAESFTTVAVSGTADITGNTTVGGTLGVTGIATFTATPVCSAALTVAATATAADLVATNSIDTQSIVFDTTSLHTGVATFTAIPVFTEVQAADDTTGITGLVTNLPAAATADAAYYKVTIGATTYAVPMFELP